MRRAPWLPALALAGLGCAVSPAQPATAPSAPAPAASAAPSASASAAPSALVFQGTRDNGKKLPPEEIQRVVQEKFARFRDCYEKGIRKNGRLEGKIAVRFWIELDGSTTGVEDHGSDLPDQQVIKCVLTSFSELRFPSPKGERVHFTYPIVFSRNGNETVDPAPPGYFAGCFVRENPGGDIGRVALECDQKAVTVVDMAAKLSDRVAQRELTTFEGQYPPTVKHTRGTPTLNGSACFGTAIDLPRGPMTMVLAPIGPHETRRVTCEERGIPGQSSPWCARAVEILAQRGLVLDLLRTP